DDDDLLRSALEPAPALSRLHAVRPTARRAAVRAAVRVLTVMRTSWVVKGKPLHLSKCYAAARDSRLRSCSFRKRLRRRIDFGVISASSSSPMNSTAYSSVRPIGGVS